MKQLLISLAILLLPFAAKAQNVTQNQKNAAAYLLQNLKLKNSAVKFLADVCRANDTLTLTCSVKINDNGVTEDVKIVNGLDDMFNESFRTTLFLMPKGVCAPPQNKVDNYFTLFFNVLIEDIRDIQIARGIENFHKRKRFARVDMNDAEFQRYNPTACEMYKSSEGVNSSLWIINMRATNLRIFSSMVQ